LCCLNRRNDHGKTPTKNRKVGGNSWKKKKTGGGGKDLFKVGGCGFNMRALEIRSGEQKKGVGGKINKTPTKRWRRNILNHRKEGLPTHKIYKGKRREHKEKRKGS